MTRAFEPVPDPHGELVPPARRPPTAVAAATPPPPERRGQGSFRARRPALLRLARLVAGVCLDAADLIARVITRPAGARPPAR
jgi:hypothetical protein